MFEFCLFFNVNFRKFWGALHFVYKISIEKCLVNFLDAEMPHREHQSSVIIESFPINYKAKEG